MTVLKREREKVADIVRDAGGQIVGRTKLQKIAFLLELTGQGEGFEFEYKHYGPYSESLSEAARVADAFGLVKEEERMAQWGGRYSVYTVELPQMPTADERRAHFASKAAAIGSVELELAATAAYLFAVERCPDPWKETIRRKPEKAADGRIDKAKEAYLELAELEAPNPLPKFF